MLAATIATLLTCPVHAADCPDMTRYAKDVYTKIKESGRELGCYAPFDVGQPFSPPAATGCFIGGMVANFSTTLLGWWNSAAKNGWATIGPRALGMEPETGVLRLGLAKRTFLTAFPVMTTDQKLTIEKTDGRAETEVTVCRINENGVTRQIANVVIPNGNDPVTRTIPLSDSTGNLIAVVLDNKSATNDFHYRIRSGFEPIKVNYGAIKGLADLHVHMMANLAFGGRLVYGAPDALPTDRCDPNAHAVNHPEGAFWVDTKDMAGAPPPLGDLQLNNREKMLRQLELGKALHGTRGVNWPHFLDVVHQKVHLESLRQAHRDGLQLVVMSAVNNELLCNIMQWIHRDSSSKLPCEDMPAIVRQIDAFTALADANASWMGIAQTPWHARQLIHENKLAVVLSIEASRIFPKEDGAVEAQFGELYRKGVRSLQLVHEFNNRFGEAARHHEIGALERNFGAGVHINVKGLTEDGRDLIGMAVANHVLVDVAHMSPEMLTDTYNEVRTKHRWYPLYNSHVKFKSLIVEKHAETMGNFVMDADQAAMIRGTGGMVGLRTSLMKMKSFTAGGRQVVANDCAGSSRSIAQMVLYGRRTVDLNLAFGSDFNGFITLTGPARGPLACPDSDAPGKDDVRHADAGGSAYFQTNGLATIAQLPDLQADLETVDKGVMRADAANLEDSAENFIRMWERAWDSPRRSGPAVAGATVGGATDSESGSVALGVACTADHQCQSGRCSSVAGTRGVCVCNEDSDCGAGRFCNMGPDIKVNACEALKADNESCALAGGGHQCRSGQCKLGRCYTPGGVKMGGTCYVDDACAQGRCSSVDGTKGSCVCKEDSDCGTGFWCDGGADLKKNACKRKLDKGEVCGTVGEFGTGHRCKSGNCKAAGITNPTRLECK
jgi:microsomal dipeptidase-like Zn-dependent dipeptidase